jgi:hypothetical protein
MVGIAAGGVAGVVIVGYLGHRMGWWGRLGRRLRIQRGKADVAKSTKKAKKDTKPKKTKSSAKDTKKKPSPKKGKEGGR